MMKMLFIIMIVLVTGCAGNDKKAPTDNTVTTLNIDGESLFKRNCASCHRVDKDFTAPALHGALQRWGGDKKAMYAFIRNPEKSREEKAYAKKLFDKWKTSMTAFPLLSNADLDAVMKYCDK